MTEQPEWPEWEGLARWFIAELGEEYRERIYANMQAHGGDPRIAEVDAWLRQRLRNELALPPEFVEFEFGRVIDAAFADAEWQTRRRAGPSDLDRPTRWMSDQQLLDWLNNPDRAR